MPDNGGDWLSSLASQAATLGSFLIPAVKMYQVAQDPNKFGSDLLAGTRKATELAGTSMGFLSDKDPTKILTGPVLAGLHHAGIGAEGDEWDKGVIGALGTGFAKGGSLMTYGALASNSESSLHKKAWDTAFSKENPVDFGMAMLADREHTKSILTDPNGIKAAQAELDSTWYGNMLAGTLTFAGFAAIDPTKGLGKVTKASRATKYVSDPVAADRLAGVVNSTLDAGGVLSDTVSGRLGNTSRSLVGRQLDDSTQAGHMMAAAGRFDNDTNYNSVMNKLDPMLGNGSTQARMALPSVAEMFMDAGKISDLGLQRQVKVNVQLALTGSGESMKWLADNVPAIAAKGKRATSAPSEFTLLRNVMDDVEANGIGNLDVGKWVEAHYGTADNVAELNAYGAAVADVRKFRTTIERGNEGAPVEFGTTIKGVQVAPRSLELLKTALNQKIVGSHLLQDGASGRTIRVLNTTTTAKAHGFVHIQDPVMGNKQLMDTLRTFSQRMKDESGAPVFTPQFIEATSERFLKASQLERAGIIDDVNNLLLTKVAEKYSPQSFMHRGESLTAENVQEMIALSNKARNNGRAYAEAKVTNASRRGEKDTYLGDLGGSDTVLDTAHLSTHLENTRFLWDWKSANEALDSFYVANRVMVKTGLSRTERFGNSNTVGLLSWYLRMWKHGVLLRPGLAARAIADTGMRSVAVIGAQATGLGVMNGVWNGARNAGSGLLKNSDRMTVTAKDMANAQRAAVAIDELRAQGSAQAVQIMGKGIDANRAGEIAGSLTTKVHNMPTPRPAKAGKGWVDSPGVTFDPQGQGRVSRAGQFHHLSDYYEAAAIRATDLEARLRGTVLPTSGGKPLGVGRKAPRKADGTIDRSAAKRSDTPVYDQPTGLRALTEDYAGQVAAREASIKGLETAKAQYETGSRTSKRRSVTTPFDVNGYTFQAVKDDMDYASMVQQATAGGTASSIYGAMSHDLQQMKSDINHGSTHVVPTDPFWAQKYAMTASELRGSYTANRLITEQESLVGKGRTPQAVEDSFLNDPKVLAEVRAMRPGQKVTRDEARYWLDDLASSVQSMTATDAAHAMMTGKAEVTAEMANAIRAGDRFQIYGPDVFRDPTPHLIDKVYNTLLNTPDIALARVPMFNGLYKANVRELVPAYVKRAESEGRSVLSTKERLDIHSRARARSLNDVRRDMYDAHRTVGAHGVMTMISPFFAPWEDAMMSWGRILYDDPSVLGRLMRYTQIGDDFHITVDDEGNPTRPFDGVAMQDKYINIPLGGRFGLESMRANVGSFNSIQQGNVPFSPGVGPLVQLSATALVANVLPNLGAPGAALWDAIAANPDNIVSKSVFPQGGIPKSNPTSMVMSQLPSWGRKLLDAVGPGILGATGGSSDFSFGSIYPTAFGTKYGDLITRYREGNGGRDPSAKELQGMQAQAKDSARAAGIASAAMAFGIGVSGNAAPQGQLYVDKMHSLNAMAPALAEQGLTPGGVFAVMYPNASRLNWSFSVNEGRLEATVNSTSAYYTNKKLMDDNKDAGWWIAGPDNLLANLNDPDSAGKTFSQSAYNQQMNASLRRRYSVSELVQQQDIAMGYGRMAEFNSAMALYMRQNNIKSLNSKNAGQLGLMKNQYTASLRDQFPEWAVDQDTMDGGGRKRQIEQIQRIAADPPLNLRDRPDVLTTQKYLFARQALVDNAQAQGVTSWQTAAGQLANRYSLWQYGQSLAAGDIVFQQAWSRLFESEFKNDLTPTAGV